MSDRCGLTHIANVTQEHTGTVSRHSLACTGSKSSTGSASLLSPHSQPPLPFYNASDR